VLRYDEGEGVRALEAGGWRRGVLMGYVTLGWVVDEHERTVGRIHLLKTLLGRREVGGRG